VLLVPSQSEGYDWEPPGARGDPEEAAETTARRGAVEAVGLDPRVEDMVLLERLDLDYGREDGVTAPTVQAVFHAVVETPEAVPPSRGALDARWFDRTALPAAVRFRETVRDVLAAGDDDPGDRPDDS
jgi:ADP-ribose pyrophosphatase YjhB (NUDIX family)